MLISNGAAMVARRTRVAVATAGADAVCIIGRAP